MELRFQAGGPESWSADAVIVFLSEDEKLEKAYPELLDAAPWMSIAPGMRDFHGKKGEMGLLYGPPAHPLSRAVVVGLGKLDALTYAETLEEIRKGAGAAAVRCRELGVDTLALPVSGLARFNADVERTIEEIVCAAMLGLWRNKAFKSKEPEDADPRWLALLFCDANVPDFPRLAARRGETHAEAVILARNLANTPANSLTPEDMAGAASRPYCAPCEAAVEPWEALVRTVRGEGDTLGGIVRVEVRYVAHTDLPRSPESWYQEIGRAGCRAGAGAHERRGGQGRGDRRRFRRGPQPGELQ